MRVLVAYASRHSATAGIAERVAAGLREAGLSAEARPVAQARDVEAYDAFVIGAAAYMFHWLKEATRFVKRHRAVLSGRPVWLFNSGPLGTEVVDEQGRDVLEATRPRQRVIPGIGTRSTRGQRTSPVTSTPPRPPRRGEVEMPDTDVRPGRHAERAPAAVLTRPPRFLTVWAATVTVLLGLVFTGTTALTIALWATDPAYTQTNPVVDLAFFALGGILITVGFASQIRARQIAGLQQAILALLALAVAGLLAGRIEPFIGALLLLVAAAPLVVLHPARRQLLSAGEGVSGPLAALGVVAVIPAVAYATAMLDRAQAAGPSCFLGQCVEGDRFAETAALAVAVVLVALLASLRTSGWMLSAWCAGIATIALGAVSLVFPKELGALGAPWAVAAAIWGAAFIVTVDTQARRAPRAHVRPGTGKAGD